MKYNRMRLKVSYIIFVLTFSTAVGLIIALAIKSLKKHDTKRIVRSLIICTAIFIFTGAFISTNEELELEEDYNISNDINASNNKTTVNNKNENLQHESKSFEKPKSEWVDVISFQGNSIKDTESFKITSNEWRIIWVTKPTSMGDMNFQIYIHKGDGSMVGVDANVTGVAQNISYKRVKEVYYPSINSAQNYSILIQQK